MVLYIVETSLNIQHL